MTDVVWRLTVTRDPNAGQTLRAWEQRLLQSQASVDRARVQSALLADREIQRSRNSSLQNQERSYRAYLARQERLYSAYLARQVRNSQDASRQIPSVFGGNRPGRGFGGGGGGRGGGGGIPGMGGLQGQLGGIASSAMGIGARYLAPAYAAYRAYQFGRESLNKYSEREMLEVRLGTLTGSKSGATDLIKQMRGLGMNTGAKVNELADVATTMAGFGVPLDSLMKRLTQLSAISQGDTERMKRLGLAFAQASGQGRLMAEELNQMIDAGFNPLQEIARTTGKSIIDLREEMRDGKLSIELLTGALDSLTSKGGQFGGMMEAMKDTTTVNLNAMSSAWDEFKVSVGRGIASFEIGGVNVVNKGSEKITSMLASAGPGTEAFLHALGGASGERANKLQTSYEAMQLEYAKGLRAKGYKSTDEVGSSFFEVGSSFDAYERMARSLVSSIIAPMTNIITESERDALVLLDLEEKRAAIAEKRAQKEKDVAAYNEARAREAEEQGRRELQMRAQEMLLSKSIAEIRLKSAKDELENRQKVLNVANETLAKAESGMLSAKERFGAMSNKEQQEALGLLETARTRGVQNLSVEQLHKLKSIGTIEADNMARYGFQNRASAAFGAGDLNGLQGRRESIMDQIRRLEGKEYSTPVNRLKREKQLDSLRGQLLSVEGDAQANFDAVRGRMAMRDSVFAGERRAIAEARATKQTVEASVRTQVDLVYKFTDDINGLVQQLAPMLADAESKRMEELANALKPIRNQIQALQLRAMANNPGR